MKKAPLFLATALLVGSLLLVPLPPAYGTTDLIPGQVTAGQVSDNQTEQTTDAVTPAPTAATTDTAQSTVVADTPTPAPATIIDTTPTPDALPSQVGAGQLSDNQTILPTADTEPPAPPPPSPASTITIAAPALPVTATPAVDLTTGLSTATAPAVTTPTALADSNVLPPITQASGTPPSGHHFPLPSDNGTVHFSHFPPSWDNSTAHFPPFQTPSDNGSVHFPHFPPSWDNGTTHFPPFPGPSDNGTGRHRPFIPHPWPPQTNPTYPPYPYGPGYTLPIDTPVIGSFTASPNYIQSGQAATLSWYVSGASVVTISPAVGSVTSNGSLAVMPTYTTTYTLYAYNSQGSVNASTIVMVTPYVSAYVGTYGTPVISSFTANPIYVEPGQPATLSWIVNNADTVTISPVVGPVANTGSFDVTPPYTTTYTLSAYNSSSGTINASTTVTVAPNVSSYVTPAYPVGTDVNTGTDSSGTASGSMLNASRWANSIGKFLNGNGTSNTSTAAVNLWPLYLLLIGLAAVASVVITALIVRKPIVAHAPGTDTKTGYFTSTTTLTATQPATLTPITTIVEIGLPAKFVSSEGITMPVAGRPLGRRDFRSLISSDKADTISRQHILVTYENGVYYIEDLGSTNGTLLNGSEIKGGDKHTIGNGDTIELAHALNLTFKV